jgi:NADH dehydrogenase
MTGAQAIGSPSQSGHEQAGHRHRVAIVGAGFGGLHAAQALRHAAVDVMVIDRTNHHLFQPLLYQMATGILAEGDIAPPIRDILRRQDNAHVMLGEVEMIDLNARRLTVNAAGVPTEVPYDSLILAPGSRQSYFGHPEYAQHAPGMKTIDDARELRGRIFGAFELAEHELDPASRRLLMTFVIVGAGPTGVELAGQVAELARAMHRNFRNIDPTEARIVLLDAASTILGGYPASLQRRAARRLERMGVEIHLETMVTGVDARGIDTTAEDPELRRIETATKIWAAGVEGSPLGRMVADEAGAGVDRAGRVQVRPDCTLPGYPEVFVVGDVMSLDDLPVIGRVAVDSARHAANTIVRRLDGDTTERPFRYRDHGKMATISRFEAVGTTGRVRVSGFAGWMLWLFVHLVGLTGFKNRLSVLSSWTISFLSNSRLQRAITTRQVVGGLASDEQQPVMSGDAATFAPGRS